jgi:hypothetical protein
MSSNINGQPDNFSRPGYEFAGWWYFTRGEIENEVVTNSLREIFMGDPGDWTDPEDPKRFMPAEYYQNYLTDPTYIAEDRDGDGYDDHWYHSESVITKTKSSVVVEKLFNFDEPLAATTDLVLHAKWCKSSANIVFDPNGGAFVNETPNWWNTQTVNFGANVVNPTPNFVPRPNTPNINI